MKKFLVEFLTIVSIFGMVAAILIPMFISEHKEREESASRSERFVFSNNLTREIGFQVLIMTDTTTQQKYIVITRGHGVTVSPLE